MSYRKIEFARIDPPEAIAPGSAPQLAWIEIEKLVVDDGYQRELTAHNWRAIRKIAAQFHWSKFSPVFVAPIEGGLYAIIDGQHRTHAAAICGIVQVPCQIVQMTQGEQAAAFAAVNGLATKVTAGQIYKAALAAGEGWAVSLRQIAEDGGCRLMMSAGSSLTKKPGQIFGVAAFRGLADRFGGGLASALKVLRETEGWRDDATYWDIGLVVPVAGALCQRPAALARPDFVAAFGEWSPLEGVAAAREERRSRQRTALAPLSVRDLMESGLIDWIDKRFPARVTAVAAEKLTRAETMARIGNLGKG